MGICISSASEEIHHEMNYGKESVVYHQENDDSICTSGIQRFGSVYTTTGAKSINQDSAIIHQGYGSKDGVFCGVFDGHGKDGETVSKIVRNRLPSLILKQKNEISKYYEYDGVNDDLDTNKQALKWKEAFISAFKVMDKEIKLVEKLDCSTSGTTAVVVIKQGLDLVIANLGDSRAILGTMAENGIMASQLTTDLKPSVPSEAERILKCNGRILALKEEPHIQRVWLPYDDSPGLAMSRAFGDFVLKKFGIIPIPDVSYRRLSSQDRFLVLASDGVFDVLSNEKVSAIVCEAENEEKAAKEVVDAALSAWKQRFPNSKRDDCTAVCLFFH
jgi:serine/threonine protein phosphatase PrpC